MLSVQPGVERQFARKKLLVHLDTLRALDASYPSGSAARTAGAPAPAASASIPERPAGTAFPSSDAMAAETSLFSMAALAPSKSPPKGSPAGHGLHASSPRPSGARAPQSSPTTPQITERV